MKSSVTLLLLLVILPRIAMSQDRVVEGIVIDDQGKPAENVNVSTFWRANGNSKKTDGSPFDLTDQAQLQEYWGRLGEMASSESVKTKQGGSFSISVDWRDRAIFAIDEGQ